MEGRRRRGEERERDNIGSTCVIIFSARYITLLTGASIWWLFAGSYLVERRSRCLAQLKGIERQLRV